MFEEPEALPLGGAWDEALLGPVSDINERMIECLRSTALVPVTESAAGVSVAQGCADPCAARGPALLTALAPLWGALDDTAQRRLASCPYLLLDAGFGQPQR